MSAILEVNHLTMRFGGLVAVSEVDLTVERGQIAGLIGPNGAGKTTLFNLLTGLLTPSAGTVSFLGQPLKHKAPHEITQMGMARTFQNIRLFREMTVVENVIVGMHCRTRTGVWGGVLGAPSARTEEARSRTRAGELLAFVGLTGMEESLASGLSYGQQRSLEIARALATDPKLLCLDEPAAGMNETESVALINLIRRIRDVGITVLIIEHDMHVVMNLCDHVTVLNFGRKIAAGSPTEIQANEDVIVAYLGRDEDAEA